VVLHHNKDSATRYAAKYPTLTCVIMTTLTTNIREVFSRREIPIEGDLLAAMRACITRNHQLRQSGIRGQWIVSIGVPFHLEPHEYQDFLDQAAQQPKDSVEDPAPKRRTIFDVYNEIIAENQQK